MSDLPRPGDSLASRTVSGFPLSIGTGLAVQTLFPVRQPVYDPDRPAPVPVDVTKYQECWINVHTLFRNIAGAADKEAGRRASPTEYRDALLTEIEVIDSLFQIEGRGVCRPVYYYTTHGKLAKSVPSQVRLRQDSTDLQKEYTEKLTKTTKLLEQYTDQILNYDTEIRPTVKTNALMLSHMAYDLLSHPSFTSLELLESHTGVVKSRGQWPSKLYPLANKDMSIIPFVRKMLLIFGDKTLIQPSDMKLRNLVWETANKRGWTPYTTKSKMLLDLELEVKEPLVMVYLRNL